MERSTELEEFVRDSYAIMARGDVEAFDAAMSRSEGTLVIGTDPDEWWVGSPAIRAAFEGQTEAMGGGFPLVAGDIRAYVDGDVGWFADRPSFALPDGTELVIRLTGVLRREDGGWNWVQVHTSIGVANESAFGQELPV
jgi:ketosteroid isomerase-like protein